jgi:hypothetical protein
MSYDKLAELRTRRNNIHRYRRLLKTKLTDLERQFIERRLSEERAAFETVSASTFPMSFRLPSSRLEPAPESRPDRPGLSGHPTAAFTQA